MTAVALAVVGCGSVSAPGSAPQRSAGTVSGVAPHAGSAKMMLLAGQRLCARPDAASRVLIARTIWPGIMRPMRGVRPLRPGSQRLHPPRLLPRAIPVRTITQASRVHALARALCALPGMPSRPMSCPMLRPGGFQLIFRADGRELPVVTVQDTGCRTVTGLGTVRWASGRPAFWKLLSSLAGELLPRPFPGGRILVPPPWRPIGPGKAGCEPTSGRRPFVARPCLAPPPTSVPRA